MRSSVKHVKSPHVGAVPGAFQALKLRRRHQFVCAKLYLLDEDGVEKFIDYKRVSNILRGVHYNGFVSLVYEGKEDEMTAMPRGTRFLRSHASAC